MNKRINKKLSFKKRSASAPLEAQFAEISAMIFSAREKAFRTIDSTVVDLYWNIGAYISQRVADARWGDGTVDKLAEFLEKSIQDSKGFNRRGLYRMKQFYEAYSENTQLCPHCGHNCHGQTTG